MNGFYSEILKPMNIWKTGKYELLLNKSHINGFLAVLPYLEGISSTNMASPVACLYADSCTSGCLRESSGEWESWRDS